MRLEWVYGLSVAILYPLTIVLIAGAGEIGNRLGLRFRTLETDTADIGTLTGAALGLLALLLAFTFSIALGRFDARSDMVLEEANAIGSTANFALMLPEAAQAAVLGLLRDYAAVRVSLGIPFDPAKMRGDIDASLRLQAALWDRAVALSAAAPQSLPVYRFVASLNEINNIHELRLSALRAHVPVEAMFMLIVVAMVAIGFAGYHTGVNGSRRRRTTLLMAFTIAGLVVMIVDLDRPARGLIQVSNQALVDAADSLPQQAGACPECVPSP